MEGKYERKFELLINDEKYVLNFISDGGGVDREVETGVARLTLGDKVVGDFPYNDLSFVRNPFFFIKPVKK